MATSGEHIQTRDYSASTFPIGDSWTNITAVLIVGYLAMGKSFAYLGLPWISVYVGEIALAAFLLCSPETQRGRWLRLVLRIRQLKRFERLLLLLLIYGGLEAVRGVQQGYPVLTALRDTAFNYYPLFLFLGIWAGLRDRSFLYHVVRTLAGWAGCYGLAYVLFLNKVPWTIPGTDGRVSLFLGPYGASTVALLGLLAFEPELTRVWHLILLNLFVLLGVQVRAEWAGFAAGAILCAFLTGKFRRLAVTLSLFVILLGVMYATGISLETPTGRGSNLGTMISADYLVARAIAPFNEGLADRLAPPQDVDFAASTTEWRLVWWANIWFDVHERLSTTLLGFGYGYPIGDLNPEIEPGTFIQTPHNDFFYALAFSGWLGVVLFILLQIELFKLLLQSYRITGQPFGLMCWAAFLIMSLFEDFLEAPFGAIPFFLLMGAALAPAILTLKHPRANGGLEATPGHTETQPA